jgi:carbamoyl-phosphate synthase small subunit
LTANPASSNRSSASEVRLARLALEDGTVLEGRGFGAADRHGRRAGLQHLDVRLPGDPDRPVVPRADRAADQPHIGNYGVNSEDEESERLWLSGLVVREGLRAPSNFRSATSNCPTTSRSTACPASTASTRAC